MSPADVVEVSLEPEVEEYPVTIMLSRDGYLKKMTDRVLQARPPRSSTRTATSPSSSSRPPTPTSCSCSPIKRQVYKCKVAQFEDTKSAQLGSYLPTDLGMEP